MLKKIKNPCALGNHALKGHLKALNIILGADFKVNLEVINSTNKTIRFEIPKGRVFENKNVNTTTQNLVALNHEQKEIQAKQKLEITIDAQCINKNWGNPNVGQGNITIFEIENKIESSKVILSTFCPYIDIKVLRNLPEGKI